MRGLVGLKLFVMFCWPRDLLVINGRISLLGLLRSMEIEFTLSERCEVGMLVRFSFRKIWVSMEVVN